MFTEVGDALAQVAICRRKGPAGDRTGIASGGIGRSGHAWYAIGRGVTTGFRVEAAIAVPRAVNGIFARRAGTRYAIEIVTGIGAGAARIRSEERRVGKECRSRRS